MHNLGQTRSSQKHNHLLLTPDTFVRTTLPGMKGCAAVVHAGPTMGAQFTQYTAELESGGQLGDTPAQRFIFVLEGQLNLEVDGRQNDLAARGFAYLPEGLPHRVVATTASRAAVIEKTYQPVASVESPRVVTSNEDAVSSHPLGDDPSLQVKCLLPDTMSFDFAVNTMEYQPGAALSMVEMHVTGARPADAAGRRHLSARRFVVSRDGRRLYLDGAVVPANGSQRSAKFPPQSI